jgi:hypothetical protein
MIPLPKIPGSALRAILLIDQKDIKHWANLLARSNVDDKFHALFALTMAYEQADREAIDQQGFAKYKQTIQDIK